MSLSSTPLFTDAAHAAPVTPSRRRITFTDCYQQSGLTDCARQWYRNQ